MVNTLIQARVSIPQELVLYCRLRSNPHSFHVRARARQITSEQERRLLVIFHSGSINDPLLSQEFHQCFVVHVNGNCWSRKPYKFGTSQFKFFPINELVWVESVTLVRDRVSPDRLSLLGTTNIANDVSHFAALQAKAGTDFVSG